MLQQSFDYDWWTSRNGPCISLSRRFSSVEHARVGRCSVRTVRAAAFLSANHENPKIDTPAVLDSAADRIGGAEDTKTAARLAPLAASPPLPAPENPHRPARHHDHHDDHDPQRHFASRAPVAAHPKLVRALSLRDLPGRRIQAARRDRRRRRRPARHDADHAVRLRSDPRRRPLRLPGAVPEGQGRGLDVPRPPKAGSGGTEATKAARATLARTTATATATPTPTSTESARPALVALATGQP